MVEKISVDRMKRLRIPSSAHPISRNLYLPPGMQLFSDPPDESFLVLDKDGTIVVERSWQTVGRWRRAGKTMSFVVRHEPNIKPPPV